VTVVMNAELMRRLWSDNRATWNQYRNGRQPTAFGIRVYPRFLSENDY